METTTATAGSSITTTNGTGTTISGTTTEERTFTQAELNAIVQKRLGEQAAKFENYEELKAKAQKLDKIEEESKSELQKATEKADALQKELDGMKKADSVRKIREEVAKELGVPANLLNGETKEECEAQAKGILSFAKSDGYPSVKDGGETRNTGSGKTIDQFANWFNELNGGK